jgi:hypothetical protein
VKKKKQLHKGLRTDQQALPKPPRRTQLAFVPHHPGQKQHGNEPVGQTGFIFEGCT